MIRTNGFTHESDSDDENSFHPPVLSKYALELLKKDEDSGNGDNDEAGEDFSLEAVAILKSNKVGIFKQQDQQAVSSTSQNTINTNQTEHETIFTKSINIDNTTTAGLSSRTGHTGTESSPWHTDTNMSRTKNRRLKPLSSLGPPKRAVRLRSNVQQEDGIQPPLSIINLNSNTGTKEASSSQTTLESSHGEQLNRKHEQSPESLKEAAKEAKRIQPKISSNLNSPPMVTVAANIHNVRDNNSKPSLMNNVLARNNHGNNVDQIKNRARIKPELLNFPTTSVPTSFIQGPLFGETASSNDNERFANEIKISPKNVGYIQHHSTQKQPLKSKPSSSKVITVNGKVYDKLELIGKGGSSKVFKVKSSESKVYAIKRICLDDFDPSSTVGFWQEIELLKSLREEDRVVKLIDQSLDQGSLLLVMECGDIDLSQVLQRRSGLKLDVEFIRFHSNEVLKCVKAVHDAGIVHSDLKPANFLFVKGMLKIIDFGIANAVPDHTMNIYRDSQVGTPNYMAPEALVDTNQSTSETMNVTKATTWKVGKPSDVWSCGCIIYQMVYGRPPYGNYQGTQRLFAIMNPDVRIEYPNTGLGGVVIPVTLMQTMQRCLIRDPSKRSTIEELLNGEFCKPRVVTEEFILTLVENALEYGNKNKLEEPVVKKMANDVWRRLCNLNL